MKALNTIATTAVVKNVLQRRALRHLNNEQEEGSSETSSSHSLDHLMKESAQSIQRYKVIHAMTSFLAKGEAKPLHSMLSIHPISNLIEYIMVKPAFLFSFSLFYFFGGWGLGGMLSQTIKKTLKNSNHVHLHSTMISNTKCLSSSACTKHHKNC